MLLNLTADTNHSPSVNQSTHQNDSVSIAIVHHEGIVPDVDEADKVPHQLVDDDKKFASISQSGVKLPPLGHGEMPQHHALLENHANSHEAPSWQRIMATEFTVFGTHIPFYWLAIIPIALCLFFFAWRHEGSTARPKKARHQYIFEDRLIYEWDQTPTTITLYAKPPGAVSMKNIEVVVWPDHLYIGRKGKPPFLEEDLYAIIDAGRSSWFRSRRGELEICLRKVEEAAWPGVILSHIESKSGSSSSHLPGAEKSAVSRALPAATPIRAATLPPLSIPSKSTQETTSAPNSAPSTPKGTPRRSFFSRKAH